MKVTETKEMFYNNSGQLQQMKFTKIMRRLNNAPPLALQDSRPKNIKAILPCSSSQSFVSSHPEKTKNTDDDARSFRSCNTLQSYRTMKNEKRSVSGQSATSGNTMVFYDYREQNKVNWLMWLVVVVGAYVAYCVLGGGDVSRFEQVSNHRWESKTVNNQLEIKFESLNPNVNTTEEQQKTNTAEQTKKQQINRKNEQEFQRLATLYIDELLMNTGSRISIDEFKSISKGRSWGAGISEQIWQIFEKKIRSFEGLKFEEVGDKVFGEIVFEL